MKVLNRTSVPWWLFLLAAVPAGFAQTVSGSISGSVSDASGASVPGAVVRLVSAATRAERSVRSEENGQFTIPSLDPGEYSLGVAAQGFKTLERKSVVLTASERLTVGTLVLQLGTVDEVVTVSAEGATVQTASAERSSAIDSKQVGNLLIYGRTVTSLLALAPGVVDPIGAGARALGGNSATNFNVLGNRNSSNNVTVDGVTMTAVGGAPNASFGIAMEAVSEVKVLLSNYQAEYGRLSGSNVEMVTKSGTLQFHGMGMYYMRNEALNANNFFNNRLRTSRPVNRFNAVTYNIGGPVYVPGRLNRDRSKLFFFWNHEHLPQKVTGALQYSTVPTALERAGDFSQSVDVNGKAIAIADPSSGQSFPGNRIPSNRVDANGLALLGVFPALNFPNRAVSKGAYNYVTAFSGKDPLSLYTLKLDYNIAANDAFSATYSYNSDDNTTPNGGGITAPFAILPDTTHNGGRMVAGHYRHVFSPTMIDEANFGYGQMISPIATNLGGTVMNGLLRSTYGITATQLNPAGNPLNLLPGMSFGGVTGAASLSYDGRFPYFLTRYVTDLSDQLTKTLGAHTFKIGIFAERMRQYDGGWASNFTGTFDFGTNVNNPLNTGYAYSNAALGVFNTYTEASSRPRSLIYSKGVDWFVQDTWRASRRLTLDYGVRFNWYQPFYNYNNQLAGFVPALYDPSRQVKLVQPALRNGVRVGVNPVNGQAYPAALIGFIAPGTGNPTDGMVIANQTPGYPKALVKNQGPLAAPRIGFAYDPFGDGKTAVRGGFGVFYNRLLGVNSAAVYSYPLVQTPVVQFDTMANVKNAQGLISPPSVVAWDKEMKTASVMNMSFTVQRRLGFGTVLDVAYVGSLGRHLTWQRNLNTIPIGTRFDAANADPTNPKVPLADVFLTPIRGYNSIGVNEAAGTSNYHSLQVSATRRFARNLQFGAAWTWSKALDYVDSDFGSVNTVAPFRAWNYGLAGFDRTHLVKVNWLWDLPRWKGGIAPARAIVNGWQVSGIATFSSGAPVGVGFTQVTSTDLSGTPSISPRILVVGDPVLPKGQQTFSQAFRTDVFRLPAVGTLGDMSKTLLRGPGIDNFDVALFKNFTFKERVNAQIRSEFYNAFNHTQFSLFDSTARFDAGGNQVNGQFGQYTAARDPRIVQLALRLSF